ncbi:MAG: 4-hydroxy-tetrahydrodipicolinate reductase, partial [Bacteroidetes bacterium]
MGREIEKMALDHGHEITAIIDNETDWDNKRDAISGADVAIEFSMPEIAVKNIRRCFEAGLPVVSGTTGWTDSFEEIRKI